MVGLIILITFITLYIFPVTITTLSERKNYKKYKRVYETLPDKTWIKSDGLLISDDFQTGMLLENRSIRVLPGLHLFSSKFIRFMDPGMWYWHRKYHKWFKEAGLTGFDPE